jgi:hypothetical protein
VSENDLVMIHALITTGSRTQVLLAYYQFQKNMFTGLYLVSNQNNYFSEDQVRNWSEVAAILGKRLQVNAG